MAINNTVGALGPDPTKEDEVTGQPVAVNGGALGNMPETSSAPSAPGALPNVGGAAPAPDAPASQPGGAEPTGGGGGQSGPDMMKDRGTPDKVITTGWVTKPEQMESLIDGAYARSKKAMEDPVTKAQGQKMADALDGQGANVGKAKDQLEDQVERGIDAGEKAGTIEPKKAKSLKKKFLGLFKGMSDEEASIFLIDFGLRAMMAGEEMGTMAALGSAGMGARGALEGRRQQAKDEERQSMLDQQALDQQDTENRQWAAEQGVREANALNQGARDQAAAERGLAGFQGKGPWEQALLEEFNVPESERRTILSGGKGGDAMAQELWLKLEQRIAQAGITDRVTVGGESVKIRDLTADQKQQYVIEALQGQQAAISGYRDQQATDAALDKYSQ